MKRVSQLTALALCLASVSTFAANMAPSLTLAQLQQQHGAVIDTRASAFLTAGRKPCLAPPGMSPPR